MRAAFVMASAIIVTLLGVMAAASAGGTQGVPGISGNAGGGFVSDSAKYDAIFREIERQHQQELNQIWEDFYWETAIVLAQGGVAILTGAGPLFITAKVIDIALTESGVVPDQSSQSAGVKAIDRGVKVISLVVPDVSAKAVLASLRYLIRAKEAQ